MELTTEEIVAAFEQLRTWCEEAWQAIVDALQPLVDFIVCTWRDMCRLHMVPRQYRDTMARRKVRRYHAFVHPTSLGGS